MRKILMGIYQLQNLINGKCYIGSSSNLFGRESSHFSQIKNGKCENAKLKNAVNKYGIENFEFSVIEYVDNKENLIKIEQYYINAFDSVKNGYNIRPIADRNNGVKKAPFSQEHRDKMSESSFHGKKTYCAKGHEYTEENIQWYFSKKTNKLQRRCKECKRISRLKEKTNCCKQGHEYTAENTVYRTRKDGRIERNCLTCRRTYHRNRARNKKKGLI